MIYLFLFLAAFGGVIIGGFLMCLCNVAGDRRDYCYQKGYHKGHRDGFNDGVRSIDGIG